MNNKFKIFFLVGVLIMVLIGFMIKIPVPLRHHDKLLHGLFYFFASIFLYFFNENNFINLLFLLIFGVFIECMQHLSNKFTHSRIHGNFDIADVYANCKGLIGYLICFGVFYSCNRIFRLITVNK